MQFLGYHVRLRLTEPRLIVSCARERRVVAEVVLTVGRAMNLMAFCLPDDHLHAALRCDRALAGSFSRRVGTTLTQRLRLPVGFAQYEPKPIEDGHHLRNLIRYILRQPERHSVDADPFREASNLPDLLGLRDLGAHTAAVLRACLPRLGRSDLLEYLGVPALEPADGPLDRVIDAALRASGMASLLGRTPRARSVRRAALAVIGHRMTLPQLARFFGMTERSISRQRALPADPSLVMALRLQLGLEAQLGPRSSLDRPY